MNGGSLVPDKNTANEALLHFAKAFFFFLLGILFLIINSQKILNEAYLDFKVVGGVHFFTLGFLTLSIFGALRVFAGVALGAQGYGVKIVTFIRWTWFLSVLSFSFGLILLEKTLIKFGVLGLGIGILLFSIHIIPALIKSKRGKLTRAYLSLALLSLWCAYLLGGNAALAKIGESLYSLPIGYLKAHIIFAIFGFVGSTVIGVGLHLIPMFALSKESSNIYVKIIFPLWIFAQFFAGIGAFIPEPYLTISFVLIGISGVLWFIQILTYLKLRVRKENDPGLILATLATSLFVLSMFIVPFVESRTLFVGLVLVGWLCLFTLGIIHRVVPFLVWFNRFARNAGRGKVPKVKDLVSNKVAFLTVISSIFGITLWSIGIYLEILRLTFCGGIFLMIGSCLPLIQLKRLYGKVS